MHIKIFVDKVVSMRILQLDAKSVEFRPIEPESSAHEHAERKPVRIENVLMLLVAIEKDDTEAMGSKAVRDGMDFAAKNKIGRVLLYPFAHLSSNLEEPQRAMNLFQYMVKEAQKHSAEVYSAPFGWNKSLSIDIKGHPLAEQSRSYGLTEEASPVGKKRKVDTSIVRKSEYSGLKEADHRMIGERLDLFSFQEVSPGMVYWHQKGYSIFKELIKLEREKLEEYSYQEIATPVLANVALWHASGHMEHYRENMFLFGSEENEQLGMKPMNCPSTILIFKSRKWSYRELPVRMAIFDKLYRNEISGSLTGLFRVREMTQDDAHIFMREDQIEQELTSVLRLVDDLYGKFRFRYEAKLSTMPDSHLGDEALWDRATKALEKALAANKMDYVIKEKEGAFYGPKIDFDISDALGRKWQCATVQVDYQLPQRFDLHYTGADDKEHPVVIIHRAILGSLERFIGIITEHYGGKFPVWLAPEQARIITISEQAAEHAQNVFREFVQAGIKTGLDLSGRTLSYKIRDAQMGYVPYIIVVGSKEAESYTISVRYRDGKQLSGVGIKDFISEVKDEIAERRDGLSAAGSGGD